MANIGRVVVEAPGKINMLLDIMGITDDGYHTVETVMQAVGLYDIIVVGRNSGNGIRVTCSYPGVPDDESNLAYKAAVAFFGQLGIPSQGLSIHIDKRIPMQAGMGGGSADAAAVILALNEIYDAGLSPDYLCGIGEKVGVDVPFCIMGGCRLGRGKGEMLTQLPPLPPCSIVIAKPAQGIDTASAFRLYDKKNSTVIHPDLAAMLKAIEKSSLADIGRNMSNVFQQISELKQVDILTGIFSMSKALGSAMTGSGSAVAGIYEEKIAAQESLLYFSEVVREVYLTKPVGHGARIIHRD